jgi:hypothetical protein
MRRNLPVSSHRGAAHGAAPLRTFPLFGFSKYLLHAVLADLLNGEVRPGSARPPMRRWQQEYELGVLSR